LILAAGNGGGKGRLLEFEVGSLVEDFVAGGEESRRKRTVGNSRGHMFDLIQLRLD